MGSVLSLFWSEEKPAQDDKYKQGVGNTPQQNKPKPKAATVGASADRNKKKKPKGKINKNMIGQPANFQHTAHIGAKEMTSGSVDLTSLKNQMEKGIMFTPTSPPTSAASGASATTNSTTTPEPAQQ